MGRHAPLTTAESLELRGLLAREDYAFSPQREYQAELGKLRTLCETTPEDEMVIQALADVLREGAARSISPQVLSYVPGRGPLHALRRIQRYLARELHRAPDAPLYVLRADVREYTDSIPLSERSRLWDQLEQALGDPALLALTRRALRAELRASGQSGPRSRFRGSPTGSRLTPWIANLYLKDVDEDLQARARSVRGIYLRYGDDLVFCCSSLEQAEQAWHALTAGASRLGLEIHPEKSAKFVLTRNGAQRLAGWRGSSALDYLGYRISRAGQLGLTPGKRSEILREARLRIRCVLESAGWAPGQPINDTLGRRVAGALNDLCGPGWRASLYYDHIQRLSSPGEMRALRMDLAREILRALLGSTHARGFRTLTWKKLIRDWGWRPPGLEVADV